MSGYFKSVYSDTRDPVETVLAEAARQREESKAHDSKLPFEEQLYREVGYPKRRKG